MTHDGARQSKLDAALDYARKGWPIIPLSEKLPCIKGGHGYKDGTTDEAQIKEWWKQYPDANIGIVTGKRSGLLVLDIDIKKGKRGDESLRALEAEHGALPQTLKSQTASGGWHFVFRMPNVKMKSRNGVREGIDLLADGKYFVAPPSTIDGKAYQWVETCEAAPCPPLAVELGQDSSVSQDAQSEDRISTLIRELFPAGKESNGNWITRCPYKENHDDATPSFDVRLADGVFLCHACDEKGSFVKLYAKVKHLSEEEARRIIRPALPCIEEMNREHAVISDFGGKCVVLNETLDSGNKCKEYTFSSRGDLRLRYLNKTVRVGGRRMSLADAWFCHSDRRQYHKVVFAPGQVTPGYYNLWQGFAVVPKKGDCSLFLEHIRTIICGGKPDLNHYVLSWMAQVVQRPSEKCGTALVLRGKEGVGKGMLCTEFGSLFGPHFQPAYNERELLGNFNAHLATAVVVFADEAFWAGHRENEGPLKALITERKRRLEFKGKDAVWVENYFHLMFSTNNEWAVPAGIDARRFCIIDVQDERMRDFEYFTALAHEMNNGGREALLDYLLHYPALSLVELKELPHTEALMETKLLTMSPTEQFWYEILFRGTVDVTDHEWKSSIKRKTLHSSYLQYAKDVGKSRRATETELGITLKKLCPHVRDGCVTEAGQTWRTWEVGTLEQCRSACDRAMHWPNHTWDAPLDDASKEREALCEAARAKARHDMAPASNESIVEDIAWERYAPAEKTGANEPMTGGSESVQPPHPQGALAEVGQAQSKRTPKRRSKQLCNRQSSRGHRPSSGEESDATKKRGHTQERKRRTPCNLRNLKKKPS